MSRLDLPGEPAFSVLRPDPPRVVPASGERAAWLAAVLGAQVDDVSSLCGPNGALAGKYACRVDGLRLFIKVASRGSVEDHLLANRIALHVVAHGVRACTLAEGFPCDLNDGRVLLGYPSLSTGLPLRLKRTCAV